jgi:hypothetical protein
VLYASRGHSWSSLGGDGVADPQRAGVQQVGAEPPAADERAQDAGPRQALEVRAGLAAAPGDQLQLADPEAA